MRRKIGSRMVGQPSQHLLRDANVLLRRDDHVLVSTRLIAMVTIPFLLGAFVILYCFPRHSARLFAWPIKPTMTSMMVASAYLGGAYFVTAVRAVPEFDPHKALTWLLGGGFIAILA
jgi:hypothetical protein